MFDRSRTTLIWCVTLLCMAPLGYADMRLDNVIIHFGAEQSSRQDVEVENTSDQPLYVQIQPHVVHNPGTAEESRELITNPREAGLLVTPNKLVVPPLGRKLIRFVNLKPNEDKERVYRVGVKPVVGDVETQGIGIKILIGYEVLVLAQPAEPVVKLVGERDGKQIRFHNQGNTNVLLREGSQCETPDTPIEECEPLAGKRLYPGNQWFLDLPLDRPVTFYQAVGIKNSVELYP